MNSASWSPIKPDVFAAPYEPIFGIASSLHKQHVQVRPERARAPVPRAEVPIEPEPLRFRAPVSRSR